MDLGEGAVGGEEEGEEGGGGGAGACEPRFECADEGLRELLAHWDGGHRAGDGDMKSRDL